MRTPIRAVRLAFAVFFAVGALATGADAQKIRHKRMPRRAPAEAVPAAAPIDKRDSLVSGQGASNGRPYWLVLAQCGGIYFKLNVIYTDAAVRARVVKPDPRANAEFTEKLKQAINTATAYFDGAERFLMTDRGFERDDAVLAYEGQARAAGDRVKTVEAGIAATKACPALYQACQQAYPKQCREPIAPPS